MNPSLTEIEQVLRTELEPLETEADQLRDQLAETQEQIDRLTAALIALSGGSKNAKRKKTRTNTREVLSILINLLEESGPLSVSDLEASVREKLSNDLGKSLNGFSFRYQEALADPQLTVLDGRCDLSKNQAT